MGGAVAWFGFDGEPLYQVVQELNRYSSEMITVEDPAIMDLDVYTRLAIAAPQAPRSRTAQLLQEGAPGNHDPRQHQLGTWRRP